MNEKAIKHLKAAKDDLLGVEDAGAACRSIDAALAALAPRKLAVGDKVKHSERIEVYDLIGINGDNGWIKQANHGPWTANLNQLSHADATPADGRLAEKMRTALEEIAKPRSVYCNGGDYGQGAIHEHARLASIAKSALAIIDATTQEN